MPTDRRFCRFNPRPEGNPTGMSRIPENGFCLNVFLVIRRAGSSDRVLLGRIDPAAPWDHLGGLDADRVAAHSGGWMLPASQLLYGESPEDAVARLDRELLGGLDVSWSPPTVLSEWYRPRRRPEAGEHWDLGFVFRGEAPDASAPKSGPWL
ncbi:MAG TPA: NUDIX hydrolase, partial [Thermoplasmata archaeon]